MIVGGMTDSYALDAINGVHQPEDDYAFALFTSAADIGPQTTVYTTAGEVKAQGYEAGGKVLTGRRTGPLDTGGAWMNFDNPVWVGTLVARGGLIYNKSRGNRAVRVVDFGDDIRSTNKEFEATFPRDGGDAAVVFVTR